MPARNSAKTSDPKATLGQGFDCPIGDGGRCALPSPPILIQGGQMRQAPEDLAAIQSLTVASQWIFMAKAMGVDGIRELMESSADDKPGQPPAVVLPCSCGHVFAARPRA